MDRFNADTGRIYFCIDLKSFYASCECAELGKDPFTTNLVVADESRKEGTICLAVTPALKKLGVKNRCRLFEIPKNIDLIIAKPRMSLYMKKSLEIYSIYLRYVSAEDIHVYSVDECFIDATDYLSFYNKTAVEFAEILRGAVFDETKITASCGIGTNMFLAKIALDITAKKSPKFLGYLDGERFIKEIWYHRPITDVWNVGPGIAKRLSKYGIYDLHGVATYDEDVLYREFGVNAELLIDHSKGVEPCTIKDVKNYRSKTTSISNGQVLFENYSFEKALVILKEMSENIIMELVEKQVVTDNISLYVGYADKTAKFTGGSEKLPERTNSREKLFDYFVKYFEKTTRKDLQIRRINVGCNDLVPEIYATESLFTDRAKEKKEHDLQNVVIGLKKKYGKNSVLKGVNFEDGATQIERNKMIGGHNAGEDADF